MTTQFKNDIADLRKGIVVFSGTESGEKDHLAYKMKLALNRIEFLLTGEVLNNRTIFDLRSNKVVCLELKKDEPVPIDSKSSLVKFYCQKGLKTFFNLEAIVPFLEDDETYFVKCELPAKKLMKHLGETQVTVSVWVGDHAQIVWSSNW